MCCTCVCMCGKRKIQKLNLTIQSYITLLLTATHLCGMPQQHCEYPVHASVFRAFILVCAMIYCWRRSVSVCLYVRLIIFQHLPHLAAPPRFSLAASNSLRFLIPTTLTIVLMRASPPLPRLLPFRCSALRDGWSMGDKLSHNPKNT